MKCLNRSLNLSVVQLEFGLLKNDYSALTPIRFSGTPTSLSESKQTILAYCNKDISCYLRADQVNYSVVTLGELVNTIVPLIDRSLFMPELEEKKDSSGYNFNY